MSFKGKVEADEVPAVKAGSLLDSLRNQADDEFANVEPWIPGFDGDGLEGTVVGIGDYLEEKYSDEPKVLRTWIVEQAETGLRWQIIPFHFNLRKLMTKNRAEVGDQVAILYVGEDPSDSTPGLFVKKYRVARKAAFRTRRETAPRVMTPEAFSVKTD